MKQNLIETAKKIMLNDKKYHQINFNDLWELVSKQEKLSQQEKENYVSDFYLDLLENPDFLRVNNELWTLRQLVTFDEYNQISKSLFNNSLSDDNEEDNYKEFMSDSEMKEMKNKYKNNVTSSLDLDDDDNSNDSSDNDNDNGEDDYE